MTTALIVLASGTSSRFEGGDKLLANLQNRPVAQHVIDNLETVNFVNRYAVIANADVENLFKSSGYVCIMNSQPSAGQGRSLSLAVETVLKDDHSAACIALADMPYVESTHILALLNSETSIIMSENKGVRMPPAVFRGQALKALRDASGETGAKRLMNTQEIQTIALSDRAAWDIDTRDNLDKAQ